MVLDAHRKGTIGPLSVAPPANKKNNNYKNPILGKILESLAKIKWSLQNQDPNSLRDEVSGMKMSIKHRGRDRSPNLSPPLSVAGGGGNQGGLMLVQISALVIHVFHQAALEPHRPEWSSS